MCVVVWFYGCVHGKRKQALPAVQYSAFARAAAPDDFSQDRPRPSPLLVLLYSTVHTGQYSSTTGRIQEQTQ